uniref:Ribosomal protein S20 n=1 Tax=Dipterosiphonia australica TaxID=2007208 RepID=A0A1Z1MM52_9FLOR|nr:ribosomal protein S20 [Dipterosiphonia australica]ARW66831.1 ribosomal protein S20 [Dipterosiphonia australica]
MPQTKSHIKNIKIILRNRSRNKKYKLAIKKAVKHYLISIKQNLDNNNKENISMCYNNLSLVYKNIDKAVKKKILHKNTASRRKSKFANMIK